MLALFTKLPAKYSLDFEEEQSYSAFPKKLRVLVSELT